VRGEGNFAIRGTCRRRLRKEEVSVFIYLENLKKPPGGGRFARRKGTNLSCKGLGREKFTII